MSFRAWHKRNATSYVQGRSGVSEEGSPARIKGMSISGRQLCPKNAILPLGSRGDDRLAGDFDLHQPAPLVVPQFSRNRPGQRDMPEGGLVPVELGGFKAMLGPGSWFAHPRPWPQ